MADDVEIELPPDRLTGLDFCVEDGLPFVTRPGEKLTERIDEELPPRVTTSSGSSPKNDE